MSALGGQRDHLASPALLRKIDQLRERNIGKHIALPQLVVVGDQSSGKSSLLENLTGIPFPRDVELCTRYVTQITSRRDSQSRIDVTIIPGLHTSDARRKLIEDYHVQTTYGQDFRSRFPGILKDVNSRMGIRTNVSSREGVVFSQDVLKIEICGPNEDYLTVVDVPGIFRTPTKGITTKDDIKLVKNMVKEYIKDKRTIILAVLASNIDISNQEILTLAEDFDKSGDRTLGVFTKPDLVKERTTKAALCNVVCGKKKELTLGYHVVRNRGADEADNECEDRELMFREEPWSSLPPDRVGVQALKARLRDLLEHIARQEFPIVRKEIRTFLDTAQKELDGLGSSRQSEREQRLYLSHIAQQFQDLRAAGLDAQYSSHTAFDRHDLRLITRVVLLSDIFKHEIETKGHVRNFDDDDIPMPKIEPNHVSRSKDIECDDESVSGMRPLAGDIKQKEFPELEGFVYHGYHVNEPQGDALEWIHDHYLQSRGLELGSFSGTILSSAFKEQSGNWNLITAAYVSMAIVVIHEFVTGVLDILCTDARVREELLAAISDELLRRYRTGIDQALFLVSIERDKRPYTLNQGFNENLQIARGQRMVETLEDHRFEHRFDKKLPAEFAASLEEIRTATKAKDNVEHTTQQIHDILSAYYKVALKRFVDNVYRQAVDHCLLTGPNSPLAVFTQEWVIRLDADQLNGIAGESPAVTGRRERLSRKIQDLEDAMQILKH